MSNFNFQRDKTCPLYPLISTYQATNIHFIDTLCLYLYGLFFSPGYQINPFLQFSYSSHHTFLP